MADVNVIYFSGEPYPVVRKKLRDWLSIEAIKNKILRLEKENFEELFTLLIDYVCAAFPVPREIVENADWREIGVAFMEDQLANLPNKEFPIVHTKIKERHDVSWDYEGREWYAWLHILSSAYSWKIEYVADLDIDDAIGLVQEIELRDQLEKEWQWGMSEIAYQFNENTKKSEFKPIPRPEWMLPVYDVKEPPKVLIPMSLMPQGLVLKWDDGQRHTDD